MRIRRRRAVTARSGPPAARRAGRYTAPKAPTAKRSPLWVPATMFAFLGLGMAVIIANFLELLAGGQRTSYLLVGLGLLVGGFILSTRYR